MNNTMNLVLPASVHDALVGAGFPISIKNSPFCPLEVGDVIAHPRCPGVALKVVARYLRLDDQDQPAAWYLQMEQTKAQASRTAPVPPAQG